MSYDPFTSPTSPLSSNFWLAKVGSKLDQSGRRPGRTCKGCGGERYAERYLDTGSWPSRQRTRYRFRHTETCRYAR